MTTSIRAHFDGHYFAPDEPVVGLAPGDSLEVVTQQNHQIRVRRLPLTLDVESVRAIATDPQQPWQPLDIHIDPELGRAIAEDPEFNFEEP